MMHKIIKWGVAIILFSGGIFHFIRPDLYNNFMPDSFPKLTANYAAGIAEIVIAILLVMKKTEALGALLFAGLMLVFLPIHIWDFYRETPAIGSTTIAGVRIVIQIFMIVWGLFFFRRQKKVSV